MPADRWNMGPRPEKCPFCQSEKITYPPVWSEEGYYDTELMEDCGVNPDDGDERFLYIYDLWMCADCGVILECGPRLYYDPVTWEWSAESRPLTPAEEHTELLKREEAAGQQKLPLTFGDENNV